MSNFDLVTDAKLSQAVYGSNIQSSSAIIDGWLPLEVGWPTGYVSSSTFGAQLYEKDGQYKIVFRGTESTLKDWLTNFDYGTFQWNDEFKDTVVFMASAIKQVADQDFGGELQRAAGFFTTTGHSQGGFESELAALLFGLKGTSLDGMGATAVVAQFRDRFFQIMQEQGVGDLAGAHELSAEDFLTRIYTAVGRLGVHAGDTDGAWSWSLTKLTALYNPALIGTAAVVGLRAHAIADIVANEELRSRSALWRLIGDASDVLDTNNATQLVGRIASDWASTQVADAGAGLPEIPDASQIQVRLDEFLQSRGGQSYDQQTLGKNILVRTSGGDALMIYADGGVKVMEKIGDTATIREYAGDGSLRLARQERPDGNGNTLVSEQGIGHEARMTVGADNKVLSAESNFYRGSLLVSTTTFSALTLADGRTVSDTTATDASGTIQRREHIEYFYDDDGRASRIVTITTAQGTKRETYDNEGQLFKSETLQSGADTLLATIAYGAPTLIDALSLVRAIQTGQPLPILASGLRLANDISPNQQLSATADAVSGLLSLMSLDAALERGDTLGAITAGAQAISFGAEAYTKALEATYGDAVNAAAEGFGAAYDVASGIGKALPALNLINAIANGDEAGVAIAGLQVLSQAGVIAAESALGMAIPYIGWAYAIYNLIDGLFGGNDVPDPWGSGQFVWDGNGVSYQAVGETGGDAAVGNVMQSVLATMNALIERVREQNPGSQLGLISQRMPSMAYDMSGYRYTSIDPLTGVEKHPGLRFDTSGNPYNAEPGSPESFQSIVEAMVRNALERGAIAPQWEVRTAQMQTAAGDPRAGLTEEERAVRDGQLAAPVEGQTQRFRPVVLDLDGDGVETTAKADGMAFNVDDSGYLKQTGWMKGDDGILVLDRNYNGQFDGGRELFSNAQVGLGRRGLGGMAWVDANYDGKLTEADPVWSELKVWRDLNQDGDQDAGEAQSLAALGVSELNYAMGTFTQNGVKKQLASPDLEADKDGTRVTVVPEGILMQSSADGKVSLLVMRIDDKTAVQANRDGVTGYEDVELIVSAADLLANDTLGGIAGRELTITGLTNFRHGSGFIDANGFIHFRPEPDYAGSDAGFDYVTQAANGQTGTGTVDVTLQNVNDAPALDTVSHGSRPIYGYTPVQWTSYSESGWDMVYAGGGTPIYDPYGFLTEQYMGLNPEDSTTTRTLVMNPAPGNPNIEYHTTPLAHEDLGTGRVIGRDDDDPATSLAYELVDQPQYGAVSLNPDGTFQYTSWKEPGVPSDRIVYEGQYAATKNGTLYYPGKLPSYATYPTSDVFQVRITDPSGASVVQSITVPHYGPYLPPTPEGGGGKKPIAVDLNGNGFEFVNVNDSNVFFDMNGDGWRRRTSWVAPSDGLLAYDIDGDGKIDKAGEISFARYKDGAQTDLEGLASFDTNGDGVFNAGDDKWRRFGVWQDANQNGITDAGEFRSLDDLGITGVRLGSDGRFQVINGQTVHGVGAMTLADGGELAIADVTLAYGNEVQAGQPGGATAIASPFSPSGEELNGTEDKDLILGKNGNNIVNAHGGDDVVFEDGGNDVIDGGAGNDVLYAGADNDLVLGGAGDDVVYAGLGDDMVFGGDGHDAILAEGGNDVVFGGAGNDLISGGWGNDVLSGDDGSDQIFGESGNDALFGRVGDDELHGMDGNDLLGGGDGNDWLDGGTGADHLKGGAGDDTYVVDDMADVITELAEGGTDTVRTTLDGYALGDHLENLALLGGANLNGSGNALDNRLMGNRGNNRLWGGAGNDRLDGGLGADTLIGGTGDDIYVVDNAADVVVENVGEGTDTVRASVSHALAEQVEKLTLTGVGAINATGNALDNTLTGNAGHNVLDGGLGADTMAGGRGNDTYWVDQQGDVVLEQAGEGVDTVMSRVDYVLGSQVENLALAGVENLQGMGNALDNLLRGNAGHNRLDGGLGADTLIGGAGDDTYVVDSTVDQVVEKAGEGADTVLASVSHTLAEHVENLTLTGVGSIDAVGNALDNVLTGNGGDNVLDGGLGADTMAGGRGNDTYWVDQQSDVVVEQAGEGIDTVMSRIDYVLGSQVENLVLAGAENLQGTGNALDNVLRGNAGHNRLDGGLGADTLIGGSGDDTYVVDNAADVVVENVGEGTDTVRASVSHTLSEQVEKLTLTGVRDISATGNALDNTLTGNAGHNVLDGGLGADTMIGGAGDDTYVVDSTVDQVVEKAGEGMDTVLAGVSHTLAEHVENLVLTSGENIDGTGNALDNTLSGNAGHNVLDGGLGADTMAGDAGNDTYQVDHAGDLVIEWAAGGIDTVISSISYVLPEHVENLVLAGNRSINGTGNDLDNALIGNAGDNVLDGGLGADAMMSGAGDDTYVVDSAADQVVEWAGEGTDTVLSSVSHALAAHVENLTLTGSADSVATGNALDNVLLGNTGHNVLEGGQGNDTLRGARGNDRYVHRLGDGLDRIEDEEGTDTVVFGAGLSLDNVALRVTEVEGVATAHVRLLNAGGCEQPDQGLDFQVERTADGQWVSAIEWFQFADGSVKTLDDLLIKTRVTYGSSQQTVLTTGRDDDIIYAGPRNDVIRSGSGHDVVFADPGSDAVYGEGGDDYLQGSTGDDVLDGGCGIDVLSGANGADRLRGGGGNNAFFGGQKGDVLEGGDAADFLSGGSHDDSIRGGAGHNVIAVNWGDGRDTVYSVAGASDTLSLGGGMREQDLAFAKSGADLVLMTGGNNQVTFKDWYASAAQQTFVNLQLVAPVDNTVSGWAVDTYDFQALVRQFDAAQQSNSKLSRWSLMNGLLDAHLAGSDSEALGGELAVRYAAGGESAISLNMAHDTLAQPAFGQRTQGIGSRFNPAVADFQIS